MFASGLTTLEMSTDSNTALPCFFSILIPLIDSLLSKLVCKGKKGTSELSLYAAADLVSSHVSNGFKHSVANLVFNRFIIDIL